MVVISYSVKVCGRIIRGLSRTYADSKKSARVLRNSWTFKEVLVRESPLDQTFRDRTFAKREFSQFLKVTQPDF